jgi:hypothetical protein
LALPLAPELELLVVTVGAKLVLCAVDPAIGEVLLEVRPPFLAE